MSPRAIEVAFLSLSPRLYTLRTLTICSILIIFVDAECKLNTWTASTSAPGLWITLFAVIATQQIISTFKWPILYEGIDILLLMVEVIGAGSYAKMVLLKPWVPETLVFLAVLAWLIVGTLSLTICFRVADIIHSKGQSLIKPFDILAHESNFNSLTKGWASTFHMLFGRSIWHKNFVGDTVSIRVLRGIMAIIVLFLVLFYALLNVILAPIKETGLSPVKSFRITGVEPADLLAHTYDPIWRVTYALPQQKSQINGTNLASLISREMFFSAVTVTAIWPDGIFVVDPSLFNSSLPVCQQRQGVDNYLVPFYYYSCRPVIVNTLWYLPDLNINVDFDLLMTGLSGMVHFSARTQLPLVIGLANNIQDDVSHTVPMTIIPGVNMAASYILGVRQVYGTNRASAAFGMFNAAVSKFWLPKIVSFYPDPTATFTGSNRSSLNIFCQDNYGELDFIQDYREHSVIDGLASVGGLWTAIGGIFAIIFGVSMLHTYYGSKPLSIFGIAHRFQGEAMKKECLERYPQILKEHRSPEQRGLLSLLRDHLINLDFLDNGMDNYIDLQTYDKEEDAMERGLCSYQTNT